VQAFSAAVKDPPVPQLVDLLVLFDILEVLFQLYL
jgi:hypothetical protein